MEILAPVASAKEAERLIEDGAGELYCGINAERWMAQYGQNVWLNRRGPKQGNMDPEELKRVVEIAHLNHVCVYLTLNQPSYDAESYKAIEEMTAELMNNYQVDGLIIADPGLIIFLRERFPEVTIHVSSLASVLNLPSAQFFKTLGVKRIVFPRYVGLIDLQGVIQGMEHLSDLEYEVFILNDGCIFEEGYCFTSHAFKGAICHGPHWGFKVLQNEKLIEEATGESFADHLKDYRYWLWLGIKNGGDCMSPQNHPMGMCGLCALPELKAMGVNSLKIVGRESSLSKKRASVQLVREALERLNDSSDADTYREEMIRLRGIAHLCQSRYMCYYR